MKKYLNLFILKLLFIFPLFVQAGFLSCFNFWKKMPSPRPSTDILAELSENNTKVSSSFLARNIGYVRYGQLTSLESDYNLDEDIRMNFRSHMRGIGDFHYWARYVPEIKKPGAKHPPDSGQFIIGFVILVRDPLLNRADIFHHYIHWKSRARNKQLSLETIVRIFTELYGGAPETVIKEFQDEFVQQGNPPEETWHTFVRDFIYDKKKIREVKETARRIVLEQAIENLSPEEYQKLKKLYKSKLF